MLAKIRSHLRRSFGEYAAVQAERTIKVGVLHLYIERMELHLRDEIIPLQKRKLLF